MSKKFIELEGVLIEVESVEGAQSVSSSSKNIIKDKNFGQINTILKKIGKHLKDSWDELNQEMHIKEAEIELLLGFEAEGNLFIAKGRTNSQIKITMKLEPKKQNRSS